MKGLHKLEANKILRESYEAKRNGDEKKLTELRKKYISIATEAAVRGYDLYIASITRNRERLTISLCLS